MSATLMLYICMTAKSTPGASDCPGIPQGPWHGPKAMETCEKERVALDKQLTPKNRLTIHLACEPGGEDQHATF